MKIIEVILLDSRKELKDMDRKTLHMANLILMLTDDKIEVLKSRYTLPGTFYYEKNMEKTNE